MTDDRRLDSDSVRRVLISQPIIYDYKKDNRRRYAALAYAST